MRAMNYRGPHRIRADRKPDARIGHPEDAFMRVTCSRIRSSGLLLHHGLVPVTPTDTTFGHELNSAVGRAGPPAQHIPAGDRVLGPFDSFCGSRCCSRLQRYGNCRETNPAGTAIGGICGYSHTAGGYDGGQAEYVRSPFTDVGPTRIPAYLHLDDAVLLTDAFPTDCQAAEMEWTSESDTALVSAAGPIGMFAANSAWLPGAGRHLWSRSRRWG